MKLFKKCSIILTSLLLLLPSCAERTPALAEVMSGLYWKEQALKDIMPSWTKYSQDIASGAFHTNLDSAWSTFGNSDKYPSMISRHLFSYSAAYLLSGNEDDLITAANTAKWLMEHAWDNEYGGWFDVLDKEGYPVQTTKTTFVQVYTITGLTMYYFVTRDPVVLEYIERSNELLETKVWDHTNGGYYDMMNRDWSVNSSNKSFSSVITPVSGYLFYLYLATRDSKYLGQIDKIMTATMENMVDSASGWVLETFDSNWKYLPGREDEHEVNIGHNIEAVWMLLRNYLLTEDRKNFELSRNILDKIYSTGVYNQYGIWLSNISRTDSALKTSRTYWWIQAYGNMLCLYLYHITGENKYLDDFRKGALAWDSGFMDRKNGDTYMSTDYAGNRLDGTKANRFKTSYHSIEQCLLNYLCLNLWVNNEPVELNFSIVRPEEGDLLWPVLIEDPNVRIRSISSDPSHLTTRINENLSVRLPSGKNVLLKVVLDNM